VEEEDDYDNDEDFPKGRKQDFDYEIDDLIDPSAKKDLKPVGAKKKRGGKQIVVLGGGFK
jgi:hypothetical protein